MINTTCDATAPSVKANAKVANRSVLRGAGAEAGMGDVVETQTRGCDAD